MTRQKQFFLCLIIAFAQASPAEPPKKCVHESGGLWGARGECNKHTRKCRPGQCMQGQCENGQGIMVFPSGGRYQGHFHNKKFHGQGTIIFCNQSKYIGHFHLDQFHGSGTRYFSSGKKRYKGQWKHDQMHGQGILYYKNGNIRYKGQFVHGKLHGFGTYFSPQGHKYYQGHWRNNARHGTGKTYYPSGQVRIQGHYLQDRFIKGNRYTQSGKKFLIFNLDQFFYKACNKEWAKKNYKGGYKKDILWTAISLYNQNISMVENGTFPPEKFQKYSAPTIKIFMDICPHSYKNRKNVHSKIKK